MPVAIQTRRTTVTRIPPYPRPALTASRTTGMNSPIAVPMRPMRRTRKPAGPKGLRREGPSFEREASTCLRGAAPKGALPECLESDRIDRDGRHRDDGPEAPELLGQLARIGFWHDEDGLTDPDDARPLDEWAGLAHSDIGPPVDEMGHAGGGGAIRFRHVVGSSTRLGSVSVGDMHFYRYKLYDSLSWRGE